LGVPDVRSVVLDTGPLVALLDAADEHHAWAAAEFTHFKGAVRVCEAVLTEALFLLRTLRPAQEKILDWVERGDLTCDFDLSKEARAVRALWSRYANVPMSLADACIVRMAEMHPRSVICTVDSDFSIYRKDGRHPLNLLTPRA
jgi:predicted nucleic acid-binding protein